jgi:predicted P-loop ATPase
VIFGTTNAVDFLRDDTGSRRFWPVRVVNRCDVEWIRAHRDGIHGAARDLVAGGATWWLEDETILEARQDAHSEAEDPWLPAIEAWLAGRVSSSVTTTAILDGLGIPMDRRSRREAKRAGAVMRALGWTQTAGRAGRAWRNAGTDGNASEA